MKIIPAIDLMDGKLVRLQKGSFETRKTYFDNPLEAAKLFSENGFKVIHIVDLSGSKEGRITTLELIFKIKNELNIKLQFGGGIRTIDDVELLLNKGIDKVVIGSLSVSNKPEFEKIISRYGADKIICAIDILRNEVMIKGWTEKTSLGIYDHLDYCIGQGVKTFLCTDIELDGMLSGPNIKMYEELVQLYPDIQIIASGGVSNIRDLIKLTFTGVYASVVGKAIYENKINLKELSEFAR